MSFDMRELYQELIIGHSKRPHNCRPIPDGASAEGYNPLCGDQVKVFLKVAEGKIEDAAFEGQGCAISVASASMMTDIVKGKTVAEAEHLFQEFQTMVTDVTTPTEHPDLGELQALSGVRDHPVRIKCAVLPWHALNAVLKGEGQSVTTE